MRVDSDGTLTVEPFFDDIVGEFTCEWLDGQFVAIECEVVCVGQSPKTEYVWYDQHAFDETGVHVATLRMQSRAMKASSPLYADQG